ncbi:copper resistance protein CopC [Nitrosomonas sp. JL21]|nr:copper resistance CopC family protein [Nitrosomonas sp. JL21]MBL8497495.1 copper resistance protein CopC [Nitrosomonas sp.]MCC7091200.1 copper resistance protein CopC [Nitrosomonas sp.]MXS78577.1 copper resistance protein CopC [Nitrosomonas sp. JL21]
MYFIRRITIHFTLLIVLSSLFPINLAMAHATLVKSDPPRRASLSSPPKQIQLWFNEKIEASYASVIVLDKDKKAITQNNPEVVAEDPKSVVLSMPEIDAGRYTVQYRVMSVDGHVIESSYDFNVKNKMQ